MAMKVRTNKFDTFGKRIEFIRMLCDMTQHEIAEAINVSVGTWQRFVYGKSEMRRDTIRQFIEVTGADRDWLEGYTNVLTIETGKMGSKKDRSRAIKKVSSAAKHRRLVVRRR